MSEPQAVPLGADDYQMLMSMQMSDDDGMRAQAQGLAKKLTPSEQQEFFDFQQAANHGKGDRGRVDNSLGGLPPEAVALSGLSVARAIPAGVSAMSQIGSAAKAAVTNIGVPEAKYWGTKTLLEKLGVPPLLAEGAAVAVSGWKRGEKPTTGGPTGAAEPMAAPSAAPAEPIASALDAPAPQAAEAGRIAAPRSTAESQPSVPTGPTGPTGPTQKELNEAALAVRRAQYQARLNTPEPAPVLEKPKFAMEETQLYQRLLKQGKSSKEALQAVLDQRALRTQLGLPTTPEVRAAIAKRQYKN